MNEGKRHPLAVFGNIPAFPVPIRVGYPNIGNRERLLQRVGEMLDKRLLTNAGPFVCEFEEKIAELIGVKYCIAVCNATLGLQIAARVLDLSGEVIVPAFTFIATPHALEWQKITPVFCDIDPNTHNIDPWKIETLITPKTSGILGVHVWGRPCQVSLLREIADRHRIRLIFDAAHALGCSLQGEMIGNFGDMEVISFHATKCVNTLEGGVIVTNDSSLALKMRSMRNFGFDDNAFSQRVGLNAKMNEFSAIMGLTLLDDYERLVDQNLQNYQQYQKEIEKIPGISLVNYDNNERNNYQYIIVEVDETVSKISRDQMLFILSLENIFGRVYFYPGCHRMEPYYSRNPQITLPNTDMVSNRVLALPTGETVSTEIVKKICHVLETIVHQGAKIKKILEEATNTPARDLGHKTRLKPG